MVSATGPAKRKEKNNLAVRTFLTSIKEKETSLAEKEIIEGLGGVQQPLPQTVLLDKRYAMLTSRYITGLEAHSFYCCVDKVAISSV